MSTILSLTLETPRTLLKRLKNWILFLKGQFLALLDVSSLYTNIPNNEGILTVAEKLRRDPSKTPIANFILDC